MAERGTQRKKLTVPYCPSDEDDGGHFVNRTCEEKLVSDYTGYRFDQVDRLDVFTYWLLLRDAVIHSCLQSERGREYLEKCWRLEQTQTDRAALRERYENSARIPATSAAAQGGTS